MGLYCYHSYKAKEERIQLATEVFQSDTIISTNFANGNAVFTSFCP
ncbi:MAG: hypothetical protein BAJALOKI1v1_330012 [Promethearchaeota archaeon]|nr:MAG: hypothetical protein BAJALOKI1v1_330012 [Candidatus Lokiarchaeota archaeon]